MDKETSIEELQALIKEFAQRRDWEIFHSPKNLSMAISAETAELMEHFLWCDSEESYRILKNPKQKQEIASELADILMYSLQFANQTGIPLAKAIKQKLKNNETRFPVDQYKGVSSKKFKKLEES